MDEVPLDVELHLLVYGLVLDLANPRLVKKLSDRGPLILVPLQTSQNELLRVLAQIFPLLLGKLYVFVQNIIINLLDIFAVKRRLARE